MFTKVIEKIKSNAKVMSHLPLRMMNVFQDPVIGSEVKNIHPRTVVNIDRAMHRIAPIGNLIEAVKTEVPTEIRKIDRELDLLDERKNCLLAKRETYSRLLKAVTE